MHMRTTEKEKAAQVIWDWSLGWKKTVALYFFAILEITRLLAI